MRTKAGKVFLLTSVPSYFKRTELILWYFSHYFTSKQILLDDYREDETHKLLFIVANEGKIYDHPKLESYFPKCDTSLFKENQQKPNPESSEEDLNNFIVSESTRVINMSTKYRVVFSVDCSPSMGVLDLSSGKVIFSHVYPALEKFLRALLEPIILRSSSGGGIQLNPEVYISVIAQSIIYNSLHVIVQGVLVTPENLEYVLEFVKKNLIEIERNSQRNIYSNPNNNLSGNSNSNQNVNTPAANSNTGPANPSNGPPGAPNNNSAVNSGSNSASNTGGKSNSNKRNRNEEIDSTDLNYFIRRAWLSLSLLPNDASPRIVLITDGVRSVNDLGIYDNLIMRLNREEIPISIIQVASFSPEASFCFIPDSDRLKFIAGSTGGIFLDIESLESVTHSCCAGDVVRNLLQTSFYFQEYSLDERGGLCSKHSSLLTNTIENARNKEVPCELTKLPNLIPAAVSSLSSFPWDTESLPPPIGLIKLHQITYELQVDIFALLNARVSEGFLPFQVQFTPENGTFFSRINIFPFPCSFFFSGLLFFWATIGKFIQTI